MTTIKGTATMKMNLEFIGGTDEDLINLAEELSETGLDSHDLGDAMGFFISECMYNDSEFSVIREEFTLHCWIEYDIFEWGK